jgi:hypothetical protein
LRARATILIKVITTGPLDPFHDDPGFRMYYRLTCNLDPIIASWQVYGLPTIQAQPIGEPGAFAGTDRL